jgi:hypothetical protein
MKKFKIHVAKTVNTKTAKNGVKLEYRGRVDDWKKTVDDWQSWTAGRFTNDLNIRVTDAETGAIIFETNN